jgi:hypothetical protein
MLTRSYRYFVSFSVDTFICMHIYPVISDQQRQAHEQPVIFYSVVVGLIGPVMVLTVPSIRKRYGWKPAEAIPTTYPGESVRYHAGQDCCTE